MIHIIAKGANTCCVAMVNSCLKIFIELNKFGQMFISKLVLSLYAVNVCLYTCLQFIFCSILIFLIRLLDVFDIISIFVCLNRFIIGVFPWGNSLKSCSFP